MALVPSHAEPMGHSLQLVRVVLSSPPEVNEPGGHTEQDSALFSLYRLSAPQSTQPPASRRYVPARQNVHCDAPGSDVVPVAHTVFTLVPSHEEPAGHGSQLVRVVLSPPDVNEPGGQTLQLLALALRYSLSRPQAVQTVEPAGARKPAAHA